MTFEQYLKQYIDRDSQAYRLDAKVSDDGIVYFFIHPLGRNGTTPTYAVVNNTLTPVVDNPAA